MTEQRQGHEDRFTAAVADHPEARGYASRAETVRHLTELHEARSAGFFERPHEVEVPERYKGVFHGHETDTKPSVGYVLLGGPDAERVDLTPYAPHEREALLEHAVHGGQTPGMPDKHADMRRPEHVAAHETATEALGRMDQHAASVIEAVEALVAMSGHGAAVRGLLRGRVKLDEALRDLGAAVSHAQP